MRNTLSRLSLALVLGGLVVVGLRAQEDLGNFPDPIPVPGCWFTLRNARNAIQQTYDVEFDGSIDLQYQVDIELRDSNVCPVETALGNIKLFALRFIEAGPCPWPGGATCPFYEPVGFGDAGDPLELPGRKFPPGLSSEELLIGYQSGYVNAFTGVVTTIGRATVSVFRRPIPPAPPLPAPPEPPAPPPSDNECDDDSDDGICNEVANQGRIVFVQPSEPGLLFPSGEPVPIEVFFDIEDIDPIEATVEIEGDLTTLSAPPFLFQDTLTGLEEGDYTIHATAITDDEGTFSKSRDFQVGGCRVQIVRPLAEDFALTEENFPIFGIDDSFAFEARRQGEDALVGPVLWSLDIRGRNQDDEGFGAQIEVSSGLAGVALRQEGERLFLDFDALEIVSPELGPITDPTRMQVTIRAAATPLEGEDSSECFETELTFGLERPVCQAKITSPSQASVFPTRETTITFTAEKRARTPVDFVAEELDSATISWRLLLEDLDVELELEGGVPGVQVDSSGETLTVDFDQVPVPDGAGGTLVLRGRNLVVEAYLKDQFGDEKTQCKARRRTVFLEEEEDKEPCRLQIVSPPLTSGDPVPGTTIPFSVVLTGEFEGTPPPVSWKVSAFGEPGRTSVEDAPIEAGARGVALSADGQSLVVDFRTFLANGRTSLLNRLVNVVAYIKPEDDTDDFCAEVQDERGFFLYDFSPGTNGGMNTPLQDACDTSSGQCHAAPPGTCNAPLPIPRALADKFQRSGLEGNEPTECSCPDRICTYVFQSMGDPVLIVTGELAMRERDAGYCVVGEDFRALRSYSSREAADPEAFQAQRWFGPGWSFNYARRVFQVGDSVVERDGMGTLHLYQSDGQGGFLPSSRSGGTLTRSGEHFLVTHPGGVTFSYLCGVGTLESIADRFGNTFTFHYHPETGTLARITDTVNRDTLFEEGPPGRIASMTLPNGDRWTYAYQDGVLTSVTDPRGGVIAYQVDAEGRITARTNALQEVRRWVYGADGRVVESVSEDGVSSFFAYDLDLGRTTWTNALGFTRTYFWNREGLVTRVVEPDGAAWTMAWDPTGRLLEETDPAATRTTYGYTPGGLLGSVTDTAQKTRTIQRGAPFGFDDAFVDVDGTTTTAQYSVQGGLEQLTNALGQTTRMVRNARGQVLEEEGPRPGSVTRFEYHPVRADRIATVNALGQRTEMEYDDLSRPILVRDAKGRETRTSYWLHRLVRTTTNALNQTRTTDYDALYNPIAQMAEDGVVTSRMTWRTLQAQKVLVARQDALSNTWQYGYDAEARQVVSVDPRGARTETTFDSRGRVLETKNALGEISRMEYTPDGLVARSVTPMGHETIYSYDSRRRLVSTIDAEGRESRTVFDDRGFAQKTIGPDGIESLFTHDALGRVVTSTQKSPDGSLVISTTSEYDPVSGDLVATTDPRGFRTASEFDVLGRTVATVFPDGTRSETVFDEVGAVERSKDRAGRETLFVRDALDREVERHDPCAAVWKTVYLPWGGVDHTEDPDGSVVRNTYDAVRRLVRVQDGEGHTVTSRYDAVGNRVAVVDQRQKETAYEFDLLNRSVATRYPDGSEVRRTLDAEGRVVATKNARGQEIAMTHSAVGELLSRAFPEGDPAQPEELYAYDSAGRRVLARNATVDELTHFDGLGRKDGFTALYPDRELSLAFTLDAGGNRLQTEDQDGRRITRTFDSMGRETTVVDPRGRELTRTYEDGEEVRRVYPEGVVLNISRDCAGRIAALEWRDQDTGKLLRRFDYEYTPAGDRKFETETRAGGKTTRTRYTHNRRHELTKARVVSGSHDSKGFKTIRYEWDPAGNRTLRSIDGKREVAEFDDLNQMVSLNGLSFAYDADGNTTREPLTESLDRVYAWDVESNLAETWMEKVSRRKPKHGWFPHRGHDDGDSEDHHAGRGHSTPKRQHLRRYRYDADNLKVSLSLFEKDEKEGEASRELRLWEGGTFHEKLTLALEEGRRSHPGKGKGHDHHHEGGHAGGHHHGDPPRTFQPRELSFYVPLGRSLAVEVRDRFGPEGWSPLQGEEDDGNGHEHGHHKGKKGLHGKPPRPRDLVYLSDVLGSTVATFTTGESHPSRSLVEYSYRPFGELVKGDPSPLHGFTGLLREDTGRKGEDLLGAMYRHLRPGLGRWISRDPASDVDGPHLLRYAASRPLVGSDLSGLALFVQTNPRESFDKIKVLLRKLINLGASERLDSGGLGSRSVIKLNSVTGRVTVDECPDRARFGRRPADAERLLLRIVNDSSRTFTLALTDQYLSSSSEPELPLIGTHAPMFSSPASPESSYQGAAITVVLKYNPLATLLHEFLHAEHNILLDERKENLVPGLTVQQQRSMRTTARRAWTAHSPAGPAEIYTTRREKDFESSEITFSGGGYR